MLLKYLLACTLLLGAAKSVCSQRAQPELIPKTYHELLVGDHVPDITLKGFLADSTRQVDFSSLYTDKLLILDFWATTCKGCIEALPKIKSLKKEFVQKLDFLLISFEGRKRIETIDSRLHLFSDSALDVVTNDTLFQELFPYRYLPHLVWIDNTGKVIAITSHVELTTDRIAQALKSNPPLRVKKDNMVFNPSRPFHLRDTSYSYRSIITDRTPGIASYGWSFQPLKMDRVFISNLPLFTLYATAAFRHNLFPQVKDRIFIETKDSLKYFFPRNAPESFRKSKYHDEEDWMDENAYCYELDFKKPVATEDIRKDMIEDLNRYFNLNGRFEKRKLYCWVMKKSGKTSRLISTKNQAPGIYAYKEGGLLLNNQNMDVVTDYIGANLNFYRVINKTGIGYPVSIDIRQISPGMSIEEINKELKPYGLRLKGCRRKISVFVISEK